MKNKECYPPQIPLDIFLLQLKLNHNTSLKKSSHKRKLECELKDKISLLTDIEGLQRADLFSVFIIPPESKEGLQLIKEKNIEI